MPPDGTLPLAGHILVFLVGKSIEIALSHQKDKCPVKYELVNKSSSLSLRRGRDELSCPQLPTMHSLGKKKGKIQHLSKPPSPLERTGRYRFLQKLHLITAVLPLLVYRWLLKISRLALPVLPSLSWLCVIQGVLGSFWFVWVFLLLYFFSFIAENFSCIKH